MCCYDLYNLSNVDLCIINFSWFNESFKVMLNPGVGNWCNSEIKMFFFNGCKEKLAVSNIESNFLTWVILFAIVILLEILW